MLVCEEGVLASGSGDWAGIPCFFEVHCPDTEISPWPGQNDLFQDNTAL